VRCIFLQRNLEIFEPKQTFLSAFSLLVGNSYSDPVYYSHFPQLKVLSPMLNTGGNDWLASITRNRENLRRKIVARKVSSPEIQLPGSPLIPYFRPLTILSFPFFFTTASHSFKSYYDSGMCVSLICTSKCLTMICRISKSRFWSLELVPLVSERQKDYMIWYVKPRL